MDDYLEEATRPQKLRLEMAMRVQEKQEELRHQQRQLSFNKFKVLFVEVFAGAGYSYDDPKDGDVKLKFLDDEDDPTSGEEAGSNDFGPDFNVYIGFTF